MSRWHIFRDGQLVGETSTKEDAIDMVRQYQKRETHPFIRSEFSIMYGEQEFIGYERSK
jgi:hypothetical protein